MARGHAARQPPRNSTRSGFAQARGKSNNPKISAPRQKTIRRGNFARRKRVRAFSFTSRAANFTGFDMRKIAAFIIAGALAASAFASVPAGAEDAPKRAFQGQWITSAEFANAEPVNVFHRQYDFESGKRVLEKSKALQNRHTLFRGEFFLDESPKTPACFSPPTTTRKFT